MNDRLGRQARFAASILAAGHGSRMGNVAKAALRIHGKTILERQIESLRRAGVCEVSVVIGPYREQLESLVSNCEARLVINGTGSTDVVTSQIAAVKAHCEEHYGYDMLVLLSDLPHLTSSHIHRLRDAWQTLGRDVHAVVPTCDGVRGHPILLSWEAVQTIAGSGLLTEGIRGWISRNTQRVQFLETHDSAYVQDVDTMEDFALFSSLTVAVLLKDS